MRKYFIIMEILASILRDRKVYAQKIYDSNISLDMKKKLLRLALRTDEELIYDFIVNYFKKNFKFSPIKEHKEIEIPERLLPKMGPEEFSKRISETIKDKLF